MSKEEAALATVRTIDAHAGGGAVRLIVGGLPTIRGRTMEDRRASLGRRAEHLARAVLTEPRGSDHMTGAVLTEPTSEGGHAGVVFLRAGDAPSFSGHGIIAAATIAWERHLIEGAGLVGRTLLFDTPAGTCRLSLETGAPSSRTTDGAPDATPRLAAPVDRVWRVRYEGPAARVLAGGISVQVGRRILRLDIVDSAGLLALVDSEAAGVTLDASRGPELRRAASEIDTALAKPLSQLAPGLSLDAVVFTAAAEEADLRSATVRMDGGVERAPSGRATAALLSVLDAMGFLPGDRPLVHEGLAGLRFEARVARRLETEGRPAVVPEVAGSAWITGEHTFLLQPDDPLRYGPPER